MEERDRQRGCREAMLVPFWREPVETAVQARSFKTGQSKRTVGGRRHQEREVKR